MDWLTMDWPTVATNVSAVVVAIFGLVKALQGLVKAFKNK